jgi:hypothetical protein
MEEADALLKEVRQMRCVPGIGVGTLADVLSLVQQLTELTELAHRDATFKLELSEDIATRVCRVITDQVGEDTVESTVPELEGLADKLYAHLTRGT